MGTVVRNVIDDGIARTTVGTVYERVAVSAVPGVEQFPETIITDRQIGGNQGSALLLGATLPYFKIGKVNRRETFFSQVVDVCLGREGFRQCPEKFLEVYVASFGFYLYTPGAVEHVPFKIVRFCQLVNKGAETDTLHDTFNGDL